MPKVPYNPVPSVEPQAIPTPNVSINTPPAAFGANVAQAFEGLGKVAEHAGNEIWSRAIALQELNNRTEADAAATDYSIKAGKAHAEFSALQGKSAVDALDPYYTSLQKQREDVRKTLSNPMAQKLFDSESRGVMARTMFNAAGHAASENKRWVAGTSQARIDQTYEMVLHDPSTLDAGLRTIEEQIRGTQAGIAGWSREKTDLEVDKAKSKLLTSMITGVTRSEPNKGAALLEKYRDQLHGDDLNKLDNTVRVQQRAVESVNIGNNTYDDNVGTDDKPGMTLAQMQTEARARAEKLNPNDPILAQHAVSALQARWNQQQHADRVELIQNKDTVQSGIEQLGPRTMQQLMTDPKVAAAIDRLPAAERNKIPNQINTWNRAHDTQTRMETYNKLVGMANNNIVGFIDEDIMSHKDLSQPDMKKLMKIQDDLKKNPTRDPRVFQAMSQLRGQYGSLMRELKVFNSTDDKGEFDKFTGALSGALTAWVDVHKKPPTSDEIRNAIAPQLFKEVTEPRTVFGVGLGNRTVRQFDVQVPEKFSNEFKAQAAADGQPADDSIVYRAYIREQLKTLYSKPKPSEAKPGAPAVPQSQ